jgi:hypothetical protein
MLGGALLFAIGILWVALTELQGSYAAEIITIMVIGLLGGGLIRIFIRENLVTYTFLAIVVTEGIILFQLPLPWSGLWMLLIPANAIGVMAGDAIRIGVAESKPKPKDVWIINGTEEKLKDRAQSMALDALASWDSAKSGRFYVERNEGLFEAVGNPTTGFIVHCSASFHDNDEWQMLGSIDDQGEAVIHLSSGPAHAPAGVVTDLETTGIALRGFFHYRGPDPKLTWASGEEVMDLRFG